MNRAFTLVLTGGDQLDGLTRICNQFIQPAMGFAQGFGEDRTRPS